MCSVEMIGKLCAGSTRYHEITDNRSGDYLSRSELAGLLAGLSPVQMNLAYAKYALNEEAERLLIANVRVIATGMAVKYHWQTVTDRPTISNMAVLAVFEIVRPNKCSHCLGTGIVGHRVCHVCFGTGYKRLSGRLVAKAIHVDECSYRRLWRQRYESVINYVQRLDSDINRALRNVEKQNI